MANDHSRKAPSGNPNRSFLIRPGAGSLTEIRYFGDRTTGEKNREEIAATVVRILKEWGEEWGEPREAGKLDASADMIADGPAGMLRMQVTRVPWEAEHWALIGRVGRVNIAKTADDAARDLIEVVRAKAAHYSPADRATLVLVLDASRSGAYDLPTTLTAFRNQHLPEALALGFQDIFLVGLVRLINLLNPPEGPDWFSMK